METYLYKVYILIVFHSENTIEKFVDNYEPNKKERITLNEIVTKYKSLQNRIKEHLNNSTYHNILKLLSMFNFYNFDLKNNS